MSIKAQINNLGHCSEGIGRITSEEDNGMVVFIDNTTIGDVVEAEVFTRKKSFLKAKLVNIVEEGSTRTQAKCPFAKVCGGCQWQHIKYEDQLKAKSNIIKDELKKVIPSPEDQIRPIKTGTNQFNYRAKVQLPLGATKHSKRLLVGYYQKNTHDIVNIKYCPIQPEEFDKIIAELRALYKEYPMEVYREKSNKGYLRHFIIRKSFSSGDILVTFVINSKRVSDHLKSISAKLQKKFPQITGITANFNTKNTNVIFGNESEVILGNPCYIETLGNKKYNISDRSFFQINPEVAKLIMDEISTIIKENGPSEKLIDIYAGISAISIYVSEHFKEIIAIENAKSSYDDAIKSFELNDISHIKYINEDANKALDTIEDLNSFKWIVIDPPRSGCDKDLLEKISKIDHLNLIYLSCNPATLARDVEILTKMGFEIKYLQPFDMFCNSYHVETICYLVKQ